MDCAFAGRGLANSATNNSAINNNVANATIDVFAFVSSCDNFFRELRIIQFQINKVELTLLINNVKDCVNFHSMYHRNEISVRIEPKTMPRKPLLVADPIIF